VERKERKGSAVEFEDRLGMTAALTALTGNTEDFFPGYPGISR